MVCVVNKWNGGYAGLEIGLDGEQNKKTNQLRGCELNQQKREENDCTTIRLVLLSLYEVMHWTNISITNNMSTKMLTKNKISTDWDLTNLVENMRELM